MKRGDRDKVRWILEAFMAEHRAACSRKDACPTEEKYEDAQDIVEAG